VPVTCLGFGSGNTPGAIMMAESLNGGASFTPAFAAHTFPLSCNTTPTGAGCQFDQGITNTSFRTNAYQFFGECLPSVATILCPAGGTATLPVMISRTQLAPIELVVRITQKSVVQIQSATTAAGGKNGLSATRKLIAEPRFLWIISSPASSRGPETGFWDAAIPHSSRSHMRQAQNRSNRTSRP